MLDLPFGRAAVGTHVTYHQNISRHNESLVHTYVGSVYLFDDGDEEPAPVLAMQQIYIYIYVYIYIYISHIKESSVRLKKNIYNIYIYIYIYLHIYMLDILVATRTMPCPT